jgi:chorismate synthase
VRRLRFSSAGESHGPAEVCILTGMPSGVRVTREDVDRDLRRRKRGYGRGARQAIEPDRVRILAGVRLGRTLGTPIALLVENRDHSSWLASMGVDPGEADPAARVSVPRPGHADLAGMAKHGFDEARPVLERSSARETVARVAAGAVARAFLQEAGVRVAGRVLSLGGVRISDQADPVRPESVPWEAVEQSELACEDEAAERRMRQAVDQAREEGESLGGVFEVWAWGLLPGVGGYADVADRLDARLSGALAGIPAVKGVEIGLGFAGAALPGSEAHDPIVLTGPAGSRYVARSTNRAGGLEGGMTNGLPLILRAAMKPIPTLMRPLPSVDLDTLLEASAHRERSDVEAVPAARVVAEAMVCLVLAGAYLEKFGGDSLEEFQHALHGYRARLQARSLWPAS